MFKIETSSAINMAAKYLLNLICFGVLLIPVGGYTVVFRTTEENNSRVLLGNIASKIPANETKLLSGVLLNVNFQILKFGDNDYMDYRNYFLIDSNADFYITQKVDREEVCEQQEVCKMKVVLFATNGTVTEFIHIDVTIEDINDNVPTFSEAVLNLHIPEGTSVQTSYALPPATDLDSSVNGIQEYVLDPERTDFQLQKQENPDGTSTLYLILNLSLDRESTASYTLYVKAIDGGDRPGILTVNINVTDRNDNRPIFKPAEYNATIDEDAETGTVVVTVYAEDRDIGENSRLAYYFADSVTQNIRKYFDVEESSGEIFVKERLDSASRPFVLYVEVKDHGSPVKTNQAKVTINIRDKNDKRPEIQMSPDSNISIKENLSVGTHVALVIVSDEDKGQNGEADCECLNSNFTIVKANEAGQNTFSLISAVVFDRELLDSYIVEINCSDKGQPPLSSNVTFTVTIIDENDHPPIFARTLYDADVSENISVGAVLLKVKATDRDTELNGLIKYEIMSFEDSAMFRIDPAEGMIQAAQNFDRETKDTYTFIVSASDQGENQRTATARVIIRITDVNDNAPDFIGDSYAMSVMENSNVSKSVGTVTATDPDLGDNGRVSYMIPAEFASFPFAILDDGQIITTEVLDREVRNLYHFNVFASDHGNPPRTSLVPVYVTVLDQNDNEPFIEFPRGNNDSVEVAHDTGPNVIIASVLAYDDDEKENQRLSYSIVGGNTDNLFVINSETGHIYLTKQISRGDIKQFTLTISVKDNGDFPLESQATLHLRFYLSDTGSVTGASVGSKGQNILIAIVISCVTFVLSVIIITIICIIKRKDSKNSLYNAKAYDEQKIMDAHRSSNRSSSSRGSQDKMLYPNEKMYMENGYAKKAKKEVSFIVEEDQDTGISMETSGQFDPVSTFKSPSPVPSKSPEYENYNQEISPPRSEKSEDKQREIHRMTSLRVHQALIQSQNNNNNNKQWPQSPAEEQARTYIGLTKRHNLDDSHSESSGETTTSDSGRGGSEEDIRSTMTISHDTDESRSPNTSSSHPFYTSDMRQPTFSSFHGNSVHKTGPVLSSFLKQKQKRQQNEESQKNSFTMNDLSNPRRNNIYNQYRPQSEINVPPPVNTGQGMGSVQNKLDFDPLLHSSKQSNLNFGNSFENESVTGRSQDDDNTTTTSGSYTINDLQDDILTSDAKDMFYKPDNMKPDTFV